MISRSHSGFTLIELLVVIGIIAILAVVVILTLNPAELLRQSRDSGRLSDMEVLKKAISLYEVDQLNGSMGSIGITYISIPDASATSTAGDQCQGVSGLPAASSTYQCAASSTYESIAGTGWIPIPFNQITGGSPVSSLPVDPVNTSNGYFFTYSVGSSNSWELTTAFESQKYGAGSSSLSATDGGAYSDRYEVGSNLALLSFDPSGGSSTLAISNVQSSSVGTSTAQITWTTNQTANSLVNYGLTTSYGSSTNSALSVTSHTISLASLMPNTLYHYEVQSQSGSNIATSSDQNFTTSQTYATIIFDASSSLSWASKNVATATITVGSGSNEILLIGCFDGTPTVTGVTVDGSAATKAIGLNASTKDDEIWYITGLSAGVHNVSTSWSGTSAGGLELSSYFGVNQGSPFDTTAITTSTSKYPSSTITTSVANDFIVDATTIGSTTLSSMGGAQTLLFSLVGSGSVLGLGSYQTASTPGTYTNSYQTGGSYLWIEDIVALQPAPG